MKAKTRPTWDLSGETHPATFPAADLDPDAALQAARGSGMTGTTT